jgi:hypothetical protein
LGRLEIEGSLIGGDALSAGTPAVTAAILQSGFVHSGRITQMIIDGDLKTGTVAKTAGIADSGSIRAEQDISSLVIRGSVVGTEAVRAVIAAGKNGVDAKNNATPAIGSLTIGSGTASLASFLDVVAGYTGLASVSSPLGNASSPDVQIGTVTFKGDILATNVVAGATAGVDQNFGTTDDVKIASTNTVTIPDSAKIISSIAKVVIEGTVRSNTDDFGIVAQRIGSVLVGKGTTQSSVPLLAGPANDLTPQEIADGTKMSVVEVAL